MGVRDTKKEIVQGKHLENETLYYCYIIILTIIP